MEVFGYLKCLVKIKEKLVNDGKHERAEEEVWKSVCEMRSLSLFV